MSLSDLTPLTPWMLPNFDIPKIGIIGINSVGRSSWQVKARKSTPQPISFSHHLIHTEIEHQKFWDCNLYPNVPKTDLLIISQPSECSQLIRVVVSVSIISFFFLQARFWKPSSTLPLLLFNLTKPPLAWIKYSCS